MRTEKTVRGMLSLAAAIGAIAVLVECAPAAAAPPPHAKAYGYRRKLERSNNRSYDRGYYRDYDRTYSDPAYRRRRTYSSRSNTRTNSTLRRWGLSSNGDLDRDGIPNHRDNDWDGDRVSNSRDRYPKDRRRR